MSKNTEHPAEQNCGLIIQQDGKPQQVLAKFLSLLLNYQFGFSIQVIQDVWDAATQVALRKNIRCIFAIQTGTLGGGERLAALNRQGEVPLFIILPRQILDRQRRAGAGRRNVFYCAWETAFAPTDASLQQVVQTAMGESGVGNLFDDLNNIPYDDLQQRVEQRLRNLNTLPTLPEIVMRIMRLVNDPHTTTDQLEQLLVRDPAIVMKLVQVVKSPIFMAVGRKSDWELADIVVRLGLKKVGAIAQQIKMINSLVKPEESGFDLRRFWEHSVACAIIADKLCERKLVRLKKRVEFNSYWIAALLHDIGKLVLGFFFWDWFERVVAQMESAQYQFRKVEAELGDMANHERVGQLLVINADMGEVLATTVGMHHTIGEKPEPLLCLINLADNLCKDIGLGYLAEERGDYDERVSAELGIRKRDIPRIREELAKEVPNEVRDMVNQCM